MNQVISVDESSFFFDAKPSKGLAKRGQRCVASQHSHHRHRLTLLLAVTTDGVHHFQMFRGSTSGREFASFVSELSTPAQQRRFVLLDNAAFHKTAAVRDAATKGGLELLLVPAGRALFLRHQERLPAIDKPPGMGKKLTEREVARKEWTTNCNKKTIYRTPQQTP